MSLNCVDRSYGFLPVEKIYRMNRLMLGCPKPSQRDLSHL